MCRGIALNDERLAEVGQREDGRRGDSGLERRECRLGLDELGESLLAEKGGEGRGDRAELLDKLVVVACKAEEAAHRPC
jgi:hypothetical protein